MLSGLVAKCGKIKCTSKEGSQTLLYILFGQDDFSRSESLEEIKRSIGDPSLLVANITELDGQQMTLDQLRSVGKTVPFLSERRLVIIKGLLERFDPKTKFGRQKKPASSANQHDECKLWVSCLSNMPDSTTLVLVDDGVGSDNPLFNALSGRAEVKSFPLLRGATLRQWVEVRVREEGGSISPQAVDLLAKLVGSNLWIMKNEINKLTLFTSGRRIETEDVSKEVSYAQQASVFAMVDAILEFKAGLPEIAATRARCLHRLER